VSGPDFFTVVDSLRAVRRFTRRPVSDTDVRRILAAATRAPSARGAEPWAFVVVRDPATRAAIASHYQAAWDAAVRFTAATDADRDLRDRPHYAPMMRAAAELAAHLAEVPVLIVCCLDHRHLGPIAAADGGLASPAAAYASIFPAVQNLLLAAHALGLGTTLTTLHRTFEEPLRTRLGIPPEVEIAALVPVGHPADQRRPARRRPVMEVAFLDRWGAPLPATADQP
jgi:nitroreductase